MYLQGSVGGFLFLFFLINFRPLRSRGPAEGWLFPWKRAEESDGVMKIQEEGIKMKTALWQMESGRGRERAELEREGESRNGEGERGRGRERKREEEREMACCSSASKERFLDAQNSIRFRLRMPEAQLQLQLQPAGLARWASIGAF